ncbi:MAG TPA: UvrD-helicase domain-containing protein [Limnobacter sp.]|uniref:UvrD-helicase domain-containing protein n=1 Tax=Limnobacter sp. TaxID=2003368 RepID=UPI002E35484D|nr:UvrD-helicase domain-containing protein [Limnobacter sp.]HEX5485503.1 UvrD-helicase domain-containing protein [Limnobacter sp.]
MSGLNAAQKEAVHYVDGPSLVLAGAGSGKTRVITQKIAHLIHEKGVQARNIAAVTFTNKAAREMEERANKLLGDGQGKGLLVCTFHSLGMRLLREEHKAAGLKQRFSILDSTDTFGLVQQLYGTTDKQLIRKAQSVMSLWKNGLLDPEQALAQAQSEEDAQIARLYRSYEATLKAYQAVDFDDLILKPAQLLKMNADIRDKWQNRLRYLLVDEVQDTNACQYDLLKLLAGPRAMFTAVGDDDQAIYAWRGATLENLRQLTEDYPQLKVIKLEQNYRSTLRILQAANRLIENNPKLFTKTLWSEHGAGEPIKVVSMNDEEHEAEQLAMMLSGHRFERRTKYGDYAILYRSNFQARVLEQALRKHRIPYVLSGGQSFFERAEIKDVMAYLRLLVNADDDPAFIRALTTPKRGIGQKTLEALGEYAGERGISLFEAVFETGAESRLNSGMMDALRTFCTFINNLEDRAQREPAGALLTELLKTISYEEWLYDQNDERGAQARWQNVLDFVKWMGEKGEEDGQNLLDLTQKVALITMLDRQNEDSAPDAVQLSTLHAAKGLEFPHVYLIGCEESILPSFSDGEGRELTDERLEEERRLMYVGVTRAQRSLTITHCKKRRKARDMVTCFPSRFIKELKLEADDHMPDETPNLSPKDRLGALKDLLTKPKSG